MLVQMHFNLFGVCVLDVILFLLEVPQVPLVPLSAGQGQKPSLALSDYRFIPLHTTPDYFCYGYYTYPILARPDAR